MIEQMIKVQSLLPFGRKVYVHDQNPKSKILPPSKPLLFLGYEPRSDAMRFLDPLSCRIMISQDFTPTILSFPYDSPVSMLKLPPTLPKSSPISEDEFVTINVPIERSSHGNQLTSHARNSVPFVPALSPNPNRAQSPNCTPSP